MLLPYKILDKRIETTSYPSHNTKAYHAEAHFEVFENNEKKHFYIHGTACGGKYFVLSHKSIFEYMDNSKPPLDIDVLEECRTKEDFAKSNFDEVYKIVDKMLDIAMKD